MLSSSGPCVPATPLGEQLPFRLRLQRSLSPEDRILFALRYSDFTREFAKTFKADLIFKKNLEFSRVEFDRRQAHVIGGVRVHVATPEDILIAKLEWPKLGESARQIEDAAGVIERQGANLDLSYVEHWVDALDLRKQWELALSRASG